MKYATKALNLFSEKTAFFGFAHYL